MPPENETTQEEAVDEVEETEGEEEEEKPILFELQILPPANIGTGKGRLVPWWNRQNQYKKRKWVSGKHRRQRREREAECSENS